MIQLDKLLELTYQDFDSKIQLGMVDIPISSKEDCKFQRRIELNLKLRLVSKSQVEMGASLEQHYRRHSKTQLCRNLRFLLFLRKRLRLFQRSKILEYKEYNLQKFSCLTLGCSIQVCKGSFH